MGLALRAKWPYYSEFFWSGLNTERYGIFLRITSECGKIWTIETPNTDTFHAVEFACEFYEFFEIQVTTVLVYKHSNKQTMKTTVFV